MPQDEPDRTTITLEVVVYAALFLLVGLFLVTLRLANKDERVFDYDPHDSNATTK
jgi:hypothetical protein